MKKIIRFSIFALLTAMLLSSFAAVMAEPAEKIPVTAVTYNQVDGEPEQKTAPNGDISHRVFTRTGNVRLTIEGQAPIEGTYVEEVHAMRNAKTGEIVAQCFDVVWTFAGSSFEGVKQTRITEGAPPEVKQHVIFQGSGIFEGCTLMLSQEAPPFPAPYTGFLLVH